MGTNRILGTFVALFILLTVHPASAESSVSERLNDSLVRIQKSATVGVVSYEEARWLKRQHRTIQIQAELFSGKTQLTGAERALLHSQINELEDSLDSFIALNESLRPEGVLVSQNE